MQAHTTGDVASLADESTPLLASPASSPRSRPPRPRPCPRPAPPPQEARDTLTLPYLTRSLAAIRAGSLPSTLQLLTLFRALLDSSFLSDFHQVPYLTNAATLSKEGEKVRSALREVVQNLEELVRARNPRVEWDEEREVWVGQTGEEGTGDGWQEFVWACRKTRVDIGAFSDLSLSDPWIGLTALLRRSPFYVNSHPFPIRPLSSALFPLDPPPTPTHLPRIPLPPLGLGRPPA